MDVLAEAVDRDIDDLLASLEIKDFMESPELAMLGLVEMIKRDIADKHIEEALKIGAEVAGQIEEDGDIVIKESTDPKENADDKV
jgi:hypothetical protein